MGLVSERASGYSKAWGLRRTEGFRVFGLGCLLRVDV